MSKLDCVNTLVGTENVKRYSNGNVLPITSVPHGMASFTIQNERSRGHWFFSPYSKSFEGIRLTHQPSPWIGDYGHLVITPQRGDLFFGEEERWSSIDNKTMSLRPHYMSGYVNRDRVSFWLTPTNSGAFIRFEFSDVNRNRVNLIGLGGDTAFEFDEKLGLVYGYTTANEHWSKNAIKEFFAVRLSVPFTVESGESAISLVTESRVVECRLATSFVSREQAVLNLKRELDCRTGEEICEACAAEWEKLLGKIDIDDEDKNLVDMFYSCMYRAFLWPRRFYEIDDAGRAIHLNVEKNCVVDGVYYADNGFWDTYRTLYPLLAIIDADFYAETVQGFYNAYLDSGWLPKWLCPDEGGGMPGTLIEATFADAIVKKIVDKDMGEKIFEAMLHNAENEPDEPRFGRKCVKDYRRYGYIPYEKVRESVNETLDCCYGDACIAAAARALGHDDVAAKYDAYAKNYRNLFDDETGFIRAKDENGRFREEQFDCYAWGRDYTEGSVWQNGFAVPHDIAGLNELYGGKLEQKIDELFAAPKYYSIGGYEGEIHEMSEMTMPNFGQCAISNQPSFHIPFIYGELGNVEKTSEIVERIVKEAFSPTPEGFPGDEDNGSMSSWYMLACLGLYSLCPSSIEYNVCRPVVRKAVVHLSAGDLVIERDKFEPCKMKNHIDYFTLIRGGDLAELTRNKS